MSSETPVKAGILSTSLASWRTPANRLEWIVLGGAIAKWGYTKYKERKQVKSITLTFPRGDTAYYWLLKWLEKLPYKEEDTTTYRVDFTQGGKGDPAVPSPGNCLTSNSTPRSKAQPILVPAENIDFVFGGVKCSVNQKERPKSDSDSFGPRSQPDLVLTIQSRNKKVVMALLEEVAAANLDSREPPKVYTYVWGWTPVRSCPTQRTAILPDNQYSVLAKDLREFFAAEVWYRAVGLPYRRGFLFHGISGSGKTTTVIALAGDFGLNVCITSLTSHTDESLLEAVRGLPANSILLLEDIDCAWGAERQPTAGGKQLTLSGLLNVLDGAATPEGRITFMTTNRREQLDEALIRPGRVDVELQFKHATSLQIAELAARFSKEAAVEIKPHEWAEENLSMATVQERLVRRYRPLSVVS